MKRLIVVTLCLLVCSCGWQNLDSVKENASKTFNQAGYFVVGYEGYQAGTWFGSSYGGACVWYTLRTIPDNGVNYHAALQRWGNEYHIYNLSAIDAIKPN